MALINGNNARFIPQLRSIQLCDSATFRRLGALRRSELTHAERLHPRVREAALGGTLAADQAELLTDADRH